MPGILSPLAQALCAEIAQRGPISFRDFMDRALYNPQYGYYGAGKAWVGRTGDFFTNVSVGPLFGQLLARQFAEMWRHLGQPKDFLIVEQGANAGHCACDVLAGLRKSEADCFAALTLWLVEPLAVLQQAQAETLREFLPQKVRWAGAPSQLPEFAGIHYSNELVDAFPVHVVVRRGHRWMERLVDIQHGGFVFVEGEITDAALCAHLEKLPEVPNGYITEVNLASAPWLTEVSSRLRKGFMLVVDYGFSREQYYRPERTTGTLSAYAAHQREPDPLRRPGEIDLTAHVDFTTLAEAATDCGLKIAGFTDQHHFMVGLGRLHFPDDQTLTAASPQEVREFKTLMHPGLMGRSFQAICFSKEVPDSGLAGFQFGGSNADRLLAVQRIR